MIKADSAWLDFTKCGRPRAIVAIPVKNEAERIEACLLALAAQCSVSGVPVPQDSFEVLLLVNNSDDGTAGLAQALAPVLPYRLHVLSVVLPPIDASAGGARRLAMAIAAERLQQGGDSILLTSDSDSRVAPDWFVQTMAGFAAGADAVAGTIVLDPGEEFQLPAALKARGALEGRYHAMLCELKCRLKPVAHDPWPRHDTESGASLALTLASYHAAGGVPDLPLGEDRALVAALMRKGFHVRHAPGVKAVTSGRLTGRATGGCADTMRRRIEEPNAPCDPELQPVLTVLRQTLSGAGSPSMTAGISPERLPLQIAIASAVLVALRGAGWLRGLWPQNPKNKRTNLSPAEILPARPDEINGNAPLLPAGSPSP